MLSQLNLKSTKKKIYQGDCYHIRMAFDGGCLECDMLNEMSVKRPHEEVTIGHLENKTK